MNATSPTGRNPLLLWTAAWQGRWDQLMQINHPWWQMIQQAASKTGTPHEVFGDKGQWCVLAYQITGDTAWAQKAWTKILPYLTTAPLFDPNAVRDNFWVLALYYDWLYPSLSASQIVTFYTALNGYVTHVFTPPTSTHVFNGVTYNGYGWRTTDTDQTQGQYFGCVATYIATLADNPSAPGILTMTYPNPVSGDGSGGVLPLGGLTATAADRTTIRNSIKLYYSTFVAGGEGPESAEYNENTQTNALNAMAAMLTSTPSFLGELQALVPALASVQSAHFTPDFAYRQCWGDIDQYCDLEYAQCMVSRQFRWQSYLLAVLAANGTGASAAAPLANILSQALGTSQAGGLSTTDYRFLLTADPQTLVPANGASTAIPTVFAAGECWGAYRSGTAAVWMHDPPNYSIDHTPSYGGNLKLYDASKHEWRLRHPVGYGNLPNQPYAVNGCALTGLGSMQQAGAIGHYSDSTVAYQCHQTGGAYYPSSYFNPPATFLATDGWTRRRLVVWATQTVVIDDWFDFLLDPRTDANFNRYRAADQALMTAATALTESILHMPVAPTVNGLSFSWTLPTGTVMNGVILTPASPVLNTYQESTLSGWSTHFPANELAWQLRIGQNALNGRTCVALRANAAPAVTTTSNGVVVDGHTYVWNADGSVTS